MESLNEIFEEILHSEKDFTDKVTKLRHVDALIEENEKKLLSAKAITESLYGEYLLKTQKTVDSSAHAQLLRSEYEALEEQERELRNEEEELTSQLTKLKEEMDCEKEHFIAEVTEFSLNYDLCGNGVLHREQQEREKVDSLKRELSQLEKEMEIVTSQQKRINDKNAELEKIESEIANELDYHKELEKKLEILKKTVSELKEEKALLDTSTNSEEFQRMQRELDACRNCQEERDCINLLKTLQNLQKESYKKQMKHMTKRHASYSTNGESASQFHSTQQHQRRLPEQPIMAQTDNSSYQQASAQRLVYMEDKDQEIDEYDLASIEAIENIEYSGGNLEDSSDDQQTAVMGPPHRITSNDNNNNNNNAAGTGTISNRVNKLPIPSITSGNHGPVTWHKTSSSTVSHMPPQSLTTNNSVTHTSVSNYHGKQSSDLVHRRPSSKRCLPRKSYPNSSLQSLSAPLATIMTSGKGTKATSSSRLAPSSKRVRFSS